MDVLLWHSSWKELGMDVYISVCTDVIPCYIGHLIYEKKLTKDDVRLILLNDDNTEIVGTFSYTDDGIVEKNWPFGFFSWIE